MNARISASSLRGWRRAPWMICRLLRRSTYAWRRPNRMPIDYVLWAHKTSPVRATGDWRRSVTRQCRYARGARYHIAGRPRWVAFSTHPVAELSRTPSDASEEFSRFADGSDTAPPRQAKDIIDTLGARHLTTSLRSRSDPSTVLLHLLADTIGELGHFSVPLILPCRRHTGAAWRPESIEPARLGCAIVQRSAHG